VVAPKKKGLRCRPFFHPEPGYCRRIMIALTQPDPRGVATFMKAVLLVAFENHLVELGQAGQFTPSLGLR
jgi:hypothetical protein